MPVTQPPDDTLTIVGIIAGSLTIITTFFGALGFIVKNTANYSVMQEHVKNHDNRLNVLETDKVTQNEQIQALNLKLQHYHDDIKRHEQTTERQFKEIKDDNKKLFELLGVMSNQLSGLLAAKEACDKSKEK